MMTLLVLGGSGCSKKDKYAIDAPRPEPTESYTQETIKDTTNGVGEVVRCDMLDKCR